MIATLDDYLPGTVAAVELVDVSTPVTRERYTGNWLGAMQVRRPDSSLVGALLQRGPRYDHPGLDGFFMAGQWVESWGGITTAAQSGPQRSARDLQEEPDGLPRLAASRDHPQ